MRGKAGTSFDVLHEGLPRWLHEPVRGWLWPFVRYYQEGGLYYREDWLRTLQARMHLEPPLTWEAKGGTATTARDLMDRVGAGDGEVGLDVVDYVLHFLMEWSSLDQRRVETAHELDAILTSGGSAWEVTPLGDGNYALTRRALGPVVEAIEDLRSANERAADHLHSAWRYLAGRDPIPDQAYFQALLAVEAAAKPVVTPHDRDATLGKMLSAIRDKPDKFRFVLGEPTDVLGVAGALWKTHRRHGTDDREAPMGMAQDEADAAVHLALTLVRWFAGGGFTRAS